ncbi:MAG: ABC transporter permease [Sedimentisphaerales bacterium]|nr:ABC transporter permease [Sedimentisphaerales bacterium]
MAVYKQTYKAYEGRRTISWFRFFILSRFSYARLFQSKFLVLFLALCMFYPFGCAAFIYLSHNMPLLTALRFRSGALPAIDGEFFNAYCVVQGSMAFLLTTLVGPSLIAPDLANGAMSLYLSRPFSRTQYVGGKITILLLLLSLITWVPGILLFLIQGGCVGWDWMQEYKWLVSSILLGFLTWIAVLSLIALALSAWVKWKIAAGASILGVFFAGAGFGAVINNVTRTHYGDFINLTQVIHVIWSDLFRTGSGANLSVNEAWTVLCVSCSFCLWLLAKRIRAFEVVK